MSPPDGLAMTIQDPELADGNARLRRLLADGLSMPGAAATAAPFLPDLTGGGRGVRAVLLYGSALWGSVRHQHSQPDFIVVTDRAVGWRGRRSDRLLEKVLPPTVYRAAAGSHVAKVCVVDVAQLRAQTGDGARDLHLAGRLCKRVALVWSRDASAETGVVDAQQSALQTVGRLALGRCRENVVSLDDFLTALLGLSYESEIRIVEPGKVAGLFEAEREHYRAVGRALLETLGARPLEAGAGRFQLADADRRAWEAAGRRLIRRSRRRALLRWPKYLATYDGWLDYLLLKLERSGTPIALTDSQRRHPFLLAAPVLYRLIRARRVH